MLEVRHKKKVPNHLGDLSVSYRFVSDNTLPVDPRFEAEIIKPVIKTIVPKLIHRFIFISCAKVKLKNLKKQMHFPFGMKI